MGNEYSINLIAYYVNMALTWITNYVTYIYDHFMEFSWTIKVASISLTISFLMVIFTLLRLGWRSWKNRRWKRLYKKMRKRYGKGIKFLLSSEANPDMTRQELVDLMNLDQKARNTGVILKNYREKITFARLVYKYRISQEASLRRTKNLHLLMNMFDMQNFLENLINKGKTRRKAEALLILRACKMPINLWIANQLRTSKRFRVRRLAMYASIMTGSNADLEYFESEFFDNNCCIYDEIELGYVLRRRLSMKRKIPNLANWAIIHKNPSTQAALVRQMRYFNQRKFCGDLEELFHRDSDKELIQEICRTWGYLKYTESEELMQDVIISQPDEVKVSILHALTRLGTGKSLTTLTDGYLNNGSEHVKYEALRCLYDYGEEGRRKFYELEANAPKNLKHLFEIFHNPVTVKNVSLHRSDSYEQLEGENLFSVG